MRSQGPACRRWDLEDIGALFFWGEGGGGIKYCSETVDIMRSPQNRIVRSAPVVDALACKDLGMRRA